MKPKAVIYKQVPQTVLSFIKETCNVSYYEDLKDFRDPEFLEDIKDAHGLLGGSKLLINKEFLDNTPMLKVVSNMAVGYNNFDIEELTNRGIMATNTPDILTDTTADLMFGLILATARRICELDNYVKEQKWNRPIGESYFGIDVHHKTLGIIGMGRIGTAIAKRANLGFDMNILYYNRSRNKEAENLYSATKCELDQLLAQSDFICIMTPLTAETRHLIDMREFKLMKDSAIFINGSRGETVNEEALVKALTEKQIAGAGLDVYEQEPLKSDSPLLQFRNVVTLPHIGSATLETREKMAQLAAVNLVKGVTNQIPPSLINKEVLEIKR